VIVARELLERDLDVAIVGAPILERAAEIVRLVGELASIGLRRPGTGAGSD
jgi:hypothetical protein